MAQSALKTTLLENYTFRISAPKGGLTHHIRWMCLLSEYFTSLTTLNTVSFFIHKERFPLKSNDRVTFIKNFVYNDKRDFYNWLKMERDVKSSINQIIYSVHSTSEFPAHTRKIKTLLVNTSVDNACKHFFKFHPFWSGHPWAKKGKDIFVEQILACNKENDSYIPNSNEEVLRINGDCLFADRLDKQFYDKITDFLNIDNQYDNANQIHQLWQDCNCKAERNILEFFMSNTYPAFPWVDYEKPFINTQVYTEEDWDTMKNTAIEYYKGAT